LKRGHFAIIRETSNRIIQTIHYWLDMSSQKDWSIPHCTSEALWSNFRNVCNRVKDNVHWWQKLIQNRY